MELRGVNDAYPLAGTVELGGGASLAQALAPVGGVAGVAVEQPLLDRLDLKLGDRFLVGNVPVVAKAVLLAEPDRLSRGFSLGPRVLTRLDVVQAGGFLSPGLPFGETARVALRPGLTIRAARRELAHDLPKSGFRIRDRGDAAPGLKKLIDQLEYFLGFIGLASLVAGGLGVSGAVGAYLEARKPSIAVLKALGADGALARNVYLIQIGVAGGAWGRHWPGRRRRDAPGPRRAGQERPAGPGPVRPLSHAPDQGRRLRPAVGGGLSLAPLGRARTTPPAALFRQNLTGRLSFGLETIGALIAAAGLAALAVITAPTPLAAGIAIAGVVAAFGALFVIGLVAAGAAGRLRGLDPRTGPHRPRQPRRPPIGRADSFAGDRARHRPPGDGGADPVEQLLAEVDVAAPRAAPALVFTEIPGDQGPAFEAAVAQAFGRPLTAKDWMRAPMASGRITAVGGVEVAQAHIDRNARWAFDNDISMSVIGAEPAGAAITAGHWWPAAYAGPPLVALDAEVAGAAHLKVGDPITLAVLGRQIDARIAVGRMVDFGAFGPSFSVILDPAALAGANLREVAIAKATRQEEARVMRALGAAFPSVNVISVREQLEAAADIFNRLTLAIRAAAAVAGLAGLLVLAGAIAAGARARAKEAAILKVLGGSRWQILAAYGVEYGAVGLIAGIAGVALGYAAAWPVVVKVFETTWSVDWAGVAALIGGAAALAGFGGLLAALQALAKRPAPILRSE